LRAPDLAADLDWWDAARASPPADPAQLRAVLDRLNGWKAQHDADRANQPGPFLKMAWDAVFGDEHERVEAAIAGIEAALGVSRLPS
jgi:hypothetical protein